MSPILLVILTLLELVLVGLILTFFTRLKKSEAIIAALQENQEELLEKVYKNAYLEQELLETFKQRQDSIAKLIPLMEARIHTMQKLLNQAEGISRSPQFLREVIQNSLSKGLTIKEIANNTGLSKDEIELIINTNNI